MSPIRLLILVALAANVVVGGLYATGTLSFGSSAQTLERRWSEPPDDALRVLFVGNSHTHVWDVPGIVQHLGRSTGEKIWVEQVAPGGTTLDQHRHREQTLRAIREKEWDVVILQNQSFAPAADPHTFAGAVGELTEIIEERGAHPILYATWVRAPWNEIYEQEGFPTRPADLRQQFQEIFHRVATANALEVAPVISAFYAFRRQSSDTRLHGDDGNHAAPEGAYLAACVLYRAITDRPVADADFVPYDIDPAVAAELRRVADASFDQWPPDRLTEPDAPGGETNTGERVTCSDAAECLKLGGRAASLGKHGRAFVAYREACLTHEAVEEGCAALGELFMRGRGVDEDRERARELFRRACEGGNEAACANVEK